MNIQTDPLNNDEHENGTRQLQENKAPGPDGITPEVLKRYKNNDIVLTFVKCILIDTQKRAQLGEKGMIPIPQKDDMSFPCNHREITFLSIASKVINLRILNRTQPKVDPQLRPNQNGLIPETSTPVNIS